MIAQNLWHFLIRIAKISIWATLYGVFFCMAFGAANWFINNGISNEHELNVFQNYAQDSKEIANILYSSVKILCLIDSSKKEIFNRVHINATWAQRCNKFLFLTHHELLPLPYLDVKLPETRAELWNKLRLTLKWTYENELNDFDFFLRADDDSFYVMENLRFLLFPYDPSEAYFFGARFKYNATKSTFMSGGAGMIFSRKALKLVVESLDNPAICPVPGESDSDDLQIGICIKNLNITAVDTRDQQGRHRMLPWSPGTHFNTLLQPHHFDYLYYPYKENSRFESCAEHMISFHYVYNDTLYLLDFLFYHAKLFGTFDTQWYKIATSKETSSLSMKEKLEQASLKSSIFKP